MGVETVSEVIDARSASAPVSRHWTIVGTTVGASVAYAALFNLSFRTDENPFDGPDGFMLLALFALKLVTVVALVIGLHRIGARIAASPALAWVAAAIWALVGVALTAVVAWAKNQGASLGVDQLWPGKADAALRGHLDPGPGPGWNPTSIVTAELVAVVLLALGVAMLLRSTVRRLDQRVITALTAVGFFCGLLIYDQVVGWPVMFDFDPFVGDAVLGVLTYELAFLPGPIDPLGAIALAAMAAANGLILVVASWVRPAQADFL